MKPLKVSPSKLEVVSHCAASPLRSAPFPWEPSPEAERGSDLHKRIELLIDAGFSAFEDVTAGLPEADRDAIKTCWDVFQSLLPAGEHARLVEKKLDLSFLGIPNGGKPDLAFYDVASKTVAVVDWKFGGGPVPAPVENKQLIAYAIGLTKKLSLQGFEVHCWHLVVCQPDPRFGDSYKTATIEGGEFAGWAEKIKVWVEAALAPDPKATPGPWCGACYCEAKKHSACAEYANWSGVQAAEKEEVKQAEAAFAVAGFHEITVSAPVPAFPIVVLSQEAVARAADLKTQIFALEVKDQDSANQMGLLVQEATKFQGQVNKNRETVKRPVLDLGLAIDAAAKKGLDPLQEAKGEGNIRIANWKTKETNRREAIAREEEAKRREAEAKRQAEEDKRLKAEADELAAQERLKAAKNKKEREAALIAQAEAANKKKAAEEATAKLEVPVAEPVVAIPVAVMGSTFKKVPEFRIVDSDKIPRHLLVVNEALLLKTIEAQGWGKDGTACPSWIAVEWVDKARSKGGR